MTDDDLRRPHAALVVNPVKADAPRLVALLRTLSAEAGWEPPHIIETSVEDPGQEATRTALAQGATAVLVAGGDGTVRAVSETMAGSGVPLSIVPSGTGNLLARNLGLALDSPATAIDAVFHGDRHPVDIGWAELTRADGDQHEHGFVVLAGIGLDAHMIANTRPGLKKSVGWVAYVDGAARSLPGAKPFRHHVRRRRRAAALGEGAQHAVRELRCAAGRDRPDPRRLDHRRPPRRRRVPGRRPVRLARGVAHGVVAELGAAPHRRRGAA